MENLDRMACHGNSGHGGPDMLEIITLGPGLVVSGCNSVVKPNGHVSIHGFPPTEQALTFLYMTGIRPLAPTLPIPWSNVGTGF